jgi:hypothetical protein
MKKFTSFLAFIMIIGFCTTINAQSSAISSIESSIRSGSASTLKNYLNTTIDLVVPGSDGTYSKTQAEQILKNFFSQNSASSYQHKQQGSSKAGSVFVIGNLSCSNGFKYRVYFLIKKYSGSYKIHQLQFEKE